MLLLGGSGVQMLCPAVIRGMRIKIYIMSIGGGGNAGRNTTIEVLTPHYSIFQKAKLPCLENVRALNDTSRIHFYSEVSIE
jgi:hypothetical protein